MYFHATEKKNFGKKESMSACTAQKYAFSMLRYQRFVRLCLKTGPPSLMFTFYTSYCNTFHMKGINAHNFEAYKGPDSHKANINTNKTKKQSTTFMYTQEIFRILWQDKKINLKIILIIMSKNNK
jgi:hypothetical protein